MSGRHRRPVRASRAIRRTLAVSAAGAASATVIAAPAGASTEPPSTRVASPAADVASAHLLRAVRLQAPAPVVTVQSGDSLSRIAGEPSVCGNPADWEGIYLANKALICADYNYILPGQKLVIACRQGKVTPFLSRKTVTSARDADGDYDHDSGDGIQAQPVVHYHKAYRAAAYAGNVNVSAYGGMQACIISRESGGNSQVMNSSGHYGLYQFSYSTWVGSGGSPGTFGHASVAEQNQVFANAVHARGYSDWRPYDGC